MLLDKIKYLHGKPPLYERGDAVMWNDPYISKQLLEMHLNSEINAASRIPASIDKTVDFILTFCSLPKMQILDLGCGPGLYCARLAQQGHHLTGVDFSINSIEYAKQAAQSNNLDINFLHKNYLDLDFENQFDMIIMIYTDFGVLVPEDRAKLLANINRALKPGGILIFDVINEKNLDNKFKEDQSWSLEDGGFWSPEPYLELKSGYLYPGEKVFLQQHTIILQSEGIKNYRFWTHFFNEKEVMEILSSADFVHLKSFENILPATSMWDGENITFYKAEKSKE